MSLKNNSAKALNAAFSFGALYARMLSTPRSAVFLIAFIVGFEAVPLLLTAGRNFFWYDELITFHVSSLQPFSHLLAALRDGTDGMPANYYGMLRLAQLFPGPPQLILRLPSVLGYLLTLIGVYWYARPRLSVSVSLAAVLLITLSPFRAIALEARSYALMVGCFTIAAVFWQRIGRTWANTVLFALFLALAVAFHYFAVVALMPFALAELYWTHLARKIRWGVWISLLLAAGPFVWSIPQLLRFRLINQNFWSPSDLSMVISTYGAYLGVDPYLALVFVVCFAIAVGASLLRLPESPERTFSPPERILIAGFIFFPPFLVVLTRLMNSGYTPRYGWPGIIGLILGALYLFRPSRRFSAQIVGAFLMVFLLRNSLELRIIAKTKAPGTVDGRWSRLETLSASEPDIPIVIGSELAYLEAAQYSPQELHRRLVQVADSGMAVHFLGSDTIDLADSTLSRFVPLAVEPLGPFENAHKKFLVVDAVTGGGPDWFIQYLIQGPYQLNLLAKDPAFSLYLVNRDMSR